MKNSETRYFAVNSRPVKLVERSDGRLDVLALDLASGDWEPAPHYLGDIYDVTKDVEEFSKEEFDALVARRLQGKPW